MEAELPVFWTARSSTGASQKDFLAKKYLCPENRKFGFLLPLTTQLPKKDLIK